MRPSRLACCGKNSRSVPTCHPRLRSSGCTCRSTGTHTGAHRQTDTDRQTDRHTHTHRGGGGGGVRARARPKDRDRNRKTERERDGKTGRLGDRESGVRATAGKGASVAHLFGEPLEQRPRSVRLRQRRHRDAALDSRAALCSRSVLGASASGPSQAVAVGSGIRRRCASALLQPALGAALQRVEVICGLVPVARERARAEELPELLQRDAPARLRDTQPPWAAVRRPARGVQIFALRPQAEGLVLRAAQEAVAVSVEQLEDRADRVGSALSGPSGRGGRALQPPVRVHSVHVARLPMPRGGGPRAHYTTARTRCAHQGWKCAAALPRPPSVQ